MAEVDTDKKVISRKNEGFPAWLNFEKLRSEGIDYIGELSGKIWTDHNTHDPGITIFEAICYSLLDLGYRTSLPSGDLFARNPAETGSDNNFFTPSQILACNPLTIADYRRLLIDVPGVKNAWLVAADDISVESICNQRVSRFSNCKQFVNGLYHIYLDLENKPENLTETEEEYKKPILEKVRKVLMAHRNLCEDFYDITVLCKQEIGVCADIELEGTADPDKIYLEIIEKLKNFLSPSPRFYRLKELLDKGRSIEDVFAGRPFDLTESHGFVDSVEFESITLKKEIHLSDVYNVILAIKDVKGIRNLRLQNCDGNTCGDGGQPWVFKIFENHVPEFSLDCSGFHFTRNGVEVSADPGKFTEYIRLNLFNAGKTLIQAPSPNLDLEAPVTRYREDLADYYPIENDFPKVYGLMEGSLRDDSTPLRKSQSLQLRGYLLFFDHLLSGYLSQLKNLRNLFAFDTRDDENSHTYFINRLTRWPGLEKLLRLSAEESSTGSSGNTLAFPVSRKVIEALTSSGKVPGCDFEKELEPYLFCSAAERDIAIHQLSEDLMHGATTDHFILTRNGCWFFYLTCTSNEFAVVGRGEYKTEEAARRELTTARFLAQEKNSYHPYLNSDHAMFSFTISAGISGYWNYLQLLTEDQKLFAERRNGFLNHLLARFAETFTDYALLSYSFQENGELLRNDIKFKQAFLSAYPEISSTRGKGYDYSLNGWNNNNVSGFEKRIEGYAGMGLGKQENLCHFEVVEFEEQSVVNLRSSNHELFSSEQIFDNPVEAKEGLIELTGKLKVAENYQPVYVPLTSKYEIHVNAAGATFKHSSRFASEREAADAISQLHRLFSPAPLTDDVYASQYQHQLRLTKKTGVGDWQKNNLIYNADGTYAPGLQDINDFADYHTWRAEKEDLQRQGVSFRIHPNNEELININAFDHNLNRVDVKDQSIIYQFTVSDWQKNFFFISQKQYVGEEEANKQLLQFLFLLTNHSHFAIDERNPNEVYIQVLDQQEIIATNTMEYADRDNAQKAIEAIVQYVNDQVFYLKAESEPTLWKYNFLLGVPGTSEFSFTSNDQFHSDTDAAAASIAITNANESYDIDINASNELEIRNAANSQQVVATSPLLQDAANPDELKEAARSLLSLKKSIRSISEGNDVKELESMIMPSRSSRFGNFGYQLVKKDGYHAWYNIDGDFTDKLARDKQIKAVYTASQSNIQFLEICYGGDHIIHQTKESAYRFLVRSRIHEYGFPVDIVLFESRREYNSIEDAQNAFVKEHASILTLASDILQYGAAIGFDEATAGENEIVFIPAETMKYFGQNHSYAAQELANLASSYPIKSVRKNDPRFATLFFCKDDAPKPPEKECECGCDDESENEVYYYSLNVPIGGGWTSNRYYNTPQQALNDFYFFLILLKYRGNYHISLYDCDCSWRMNLREILAVSVKRFPTQAAAWGNEGVEKFVCVTQSENAFQPYHELEDCCYTFHIGCGNLGLVHPCKYDTPQKRDESLKKLFRASQRLLENIKKDDFREIWGTIGATLQPEVGDRQIRSTCDGALINARRIKKSSVKQQFESYPEIWEVLKEYAHYFPIVKRKLDIPGEDVYRFYIEIKLQGFCDEVLIENEPSGCDEKNQHQPCSCCCTAWVSDCCFDTCEEALRHFYKIASCLSDSNNYRRVFDCECGSYGIQLICDCDNIDRQNSDNDAQNCCNEIVAYNPQCYPTPEMACDAVTRAKNLVNAEGLHLIEHILLRPHCVEGDCDCIIPVCEEKTDCRFEWELPKGDPCDENVKYCFVPGDDPYSFVATAILPAWPARFRKKENRKLIEQMLYRETPAHILLRVLWLGPHDLCAFESIYRNWIKWLAGKPVCEQYSPPCKLVDFLFRQTFDCFDCEECVPCNDETSQPDPCVRARSFGEDANEYVNTINKLYCWAPICLEDYQQKIFDQDLLIIDTLEDEDYERKIDQRFSGYREKVTQVADATKNVAAAMAVAFVHHPSPVINNYTEVIDAVLENKKSTGNSKALSAEQKRTLIQAITWYYADKIVLANQVEGQKSDLKELFRKLNKKNLLPEYRSWHGTELMKMKPAAPVNELKKLFRK